ACAAGTGPATPKPTTVASRAATRSARAVREIFTTLPEYLSRLLTGLHAALVRALARAAIGRERARSTRDPALRACRGSDAVRVGAVDRAVAVVVDAVRAERLRVRVRSAIGGTGA